MANKVMVQCQICKEMKRPSYVMSLELLRKPVIEVIKNAHSELKDDANIYGNE